MAELPQSDILHLINLGTWAQNHAVPVLRDLARADGDVADAAQDLLDLLPKRVVEPKEVTSDNLEAIDQLEQQDIAEDTCPTTP